MPNPLSCDTPKLVEEVVVPAPARPPKQCRKCRRVRPASAFAETINQVNRIDSNGNIMLRNICRDCEQEDNKQ